MGRLYLSSLGSCLVFGLVVGGVHHARDGVGALGTGRSGVRGDGDLDSVGYLVVLAGSDQSDHRLPEEGGGAMGLLAAAADVTNAIADSDLGRLVILLGGGGALLWFIIRNMVAYQRYFTNFYMEENVKLRLEVKETREEVDELRAQVGTKDLEILQLQLKNGSLQVQVDMLKERMKNAGLS
jgi:hypothetical protein